MIRTPARWVVPEPEPALARSLAHDAGVSPVTAQVLLNRGVRDADAIARFLAPTLSELEEPAHMADADAAASRLREALARRERVLVFGDYDADGITASALLCRFLRLCGADCSVYLPSRLDEGYGLTDAAAREIVRRRPELVVTADCGTRSSAQVAGLRSAGIDVIVTDHHEPGGALPPANAVLNPKRPDCPYPFKGLAGVGVAFKLAWAAATRFSLSKKASPEHRKFLLDSMALVALGTVSDVAPLLGENRVLVGYGLKVLSSSAHPGLRSLIEVSRLGDGRLRASDVAFRLAPRLNAAGRTGSPDDALALLLEENPERAMALARRLDSANRRRQQLENGVLREVESALERDGPPGAAVVLGSEDWHQGVLGVVCSRIMERTGRPAALVAFDGEEGKGSVRSPEGIDAAAALEACRAHLVEYGGHASAGGFRVLRSEFEGFKSAFERAVRAQPGGRTLEPLLRCEAEVAPEELTPELAEELERLEPFGCGNPRPVFSARGLELDGDFRPLGLEGRHCAFRVSSGGRSLRAVAFDLGERRRDLEDCLSRGADLAFEISRSEWSGPEGFELVVKDVRPAGSGGRRGGMAFVRRGGGAAQ